MCGLSTACLHLATPFFPLHSQSGNSENVNDSSLHPRPSDTGSKWSCVLYWFICSTEGKKGLSSSLFFLGRFFFRERWISKCHWQLVFRKRVGDISSPFISLPPVSLQVSLWHTLRSATCRCGHGTSKPWLIKHLFTDVPLFSELFIVSCCQSVCDGLKVVVLAICVFVSCALLVVVTVRCHSLLFGFFFHSVLL